ncbi:MAG: hypothetical protein ACM3ML_09500 [Micromonosporaceae bacterium]
MIRSSWVTALLASTVLLPMGLEAQHVPTRAGFWWGLGVGYGSWRFSADSAARRSGDGGMGQGYLVAGYTLDPHWTIGIEAARGTITGTTGAVSGWSVIGTWYPWRARGWFLRAGLGTSSYSEPSGAEAPRYRGSGTGFVTAIGVDLGTNAGISLTPMLGYRYGSVGTVGLGFPGLDLARGFRQHAIGLTLGLTIP